MKNIFLILIFVSALVSGYDTQAQNLNRFPRLKERIAQAKLHEIRQNLKLRQADFEQFRPIYMSYEKELSGIDFRTPPPPLNVEADSLSEEEADLLITNQLKTAKSLIALREKYYHEFRTVLSPQQIIKLYQTEAEMRKKVMQELKNRRLGKKNEN